MVKRLIPEGATMCSLCSRLRRGVLYRVAGELGATKIALGHHADDLMATFFLNLFFGGKLKTMPPKLVSDNGKHVVIRPLAYVRERDLAALRRAARVPADSLHAVRLAGAPAAQAGHADAARVGAQVPGPHRLDLPRAGHGRSLRTCSTGDCRTSPRCARPAGRSPDGDIAFDVDAALEAAVESRRAKPMRDRRRDRADAKAPFARGSVMRPAPRRCRHHSRMLRRGGWPRPLAILGAQVPAAPLHGADIRSRRRPMRRRSQDAALVAALRRGGYVLYLRHTSTDFSQNDRAMTGYADCATQRNLTDAGRAEAREIGAALSGAGDPRRPRCSPAPIAGRWKPAAWCSAARRRRLRCAAGRRRPTMPSATRSCGRCSRRRCCRAPTSRSPATAIPLSPSPVRPIWRRGKWPSCCAAGRRTVQRRRAHPPRPTGPR